MNGSVSKRGVLNLAAEQTDVPPPPPRTMVTSSPNFSKFLGVPKQTPTTWLFGAASPTPSPFPVCSPQLCCPEELYFLFLLKKKRTVDHGSFLVPVALSSTLLHGLERALDQLL